ncbi:acyltransferase family protein [Terriglobus roseus]|uniref:Exopolysaccharide production protein ExoZ n=1 Tax=Terriglobus roseus TaxID=392734 RepID=A0A1G7FR85_9BACT|nr:acyltransferase [Terriglobus roseus]SDE78426.1 exopolysaccharide production protein ExoZ [Terriglobus roseus]
MSDLSVSNSTAEIVAPSIGPQETKQKIYSIQHLRWFAATLVVMRHTLGHFPDEVISRNYLTRSGEFGVDIFFVISGFILWYISAQSRPRPFPFLLNRITRIYPPYWFFTLAMVATAIVLPKAFRFAYVKPLFVAKSLLLFPAWHPILHNINPVLPIGWTLQYEVFFYLLFAVLLLLPPSKRLLGNLSALIVLVVLGRLVHFNSPPLHVYTDLPLLEFGAGMVIGALYEKRRLVPPFVGIGMAIVALVWMYPMTRFVDSVYRPLAWGPQAALLVYGILSAEYGTRVTWNLRLLELLGDASYSLYLCHLFALGALRMVWKPFPEFGTTACVLYVLTGILLATVMGLLSHIYLEKPMVKVMRRFVERFLAKKKSTTAFPVESRA